MNKFTQFGLLASLIRTLTDKGITKPTEIQNNTIPLLMSGQSVVGVAETGSGKTLAYALPLLHILKSLEESGNPVKTPASPRAIVMVPTRELGEQVSKVFKSLTHDTRLRVRPALGGMAMEHARRNVAGDFEVLLATPGRILQLMDQGDLHLTEVRMLVFDEADQMMDQGFLQDSRSVYDACPEGTQLALFSATISTAVQDLINDLFTNAEIVRSSGSGKVVSSLTTQNIIVKDGDRWTHLERLLNKKVEGGTILFTNTREQCDKLATELEARGIEAAIYRGEMEKSDRRNNLKRFAKGEVKLLVATDLAGRGLDIPSVDRVINYHLPRQLENYLHRAGRTARAGRKGLVVNLVTERDEFLLAKLEGRSIKEIDSSKYNSHPRASAKKHAAKKGSGKGTALPKRTPKVENKLKAASPKAGALNKKADKTAGAPSNKAHKAAHGGKKLGFQKPTQKTKGPSKRA